MHLQHKFSIQKNVEFLLLIKSQFKTNAPSILQNQRTQDMSSFAQFQMSGVAANSLTDMKNELKCLFVSNWSWINLRFLFPLWHFPSKEILLSIWRYLLFSQRSRSIRRTTLTHTSKHRNSGAEIWHHSDFNSFVLLATCNACIKFITINSYSLICCFFFLQPRFLMQTFVKPFEVKNQIYRLYMVQPLWRIKHRFLKRHPITTNTLSWICLLNSELFRPQAWPMIRPQ